MKNDFIIGIPTLNRKDLLLPSLESYKKDFPNIEIHVIDNGKQNLKSDKNVIVHTEDENLGVAKSWNKICDIGFKSVNHVLLVNDDVFLGYGEKEVNRIISSMQIGISQSMHLWSVVLIRKDIFDEIGRFDEQFYPAYLEDSDYIYRLNLVGKRQGIDTRLNPKVVKHGGTWESKPEVVSQYLNQNREKYVAKWGGLPFLETFTNPYNQ